MRQTLYVVLLLIQVSAFSQDLIVTNYTGPTTFSQYEEITMDFTVKNTGIVSINSYFIVTAYLSEDAQWQDSDKAIRTITPLQLGAGESITQRPYAGPMDVAPGTYYLIIKGDDTGKITETDETNNILTIPNIVINQPNVDFTLTTFLLDKASYSQNSLVKPSYVLKNLGLTNVGNYVSIQFMLSTDATFSQSDIVFGHRAETLTGPDVINSPSQLSFVLPTVSNGSYYILVSVDNSHNTTGRFVETNETNNVFSIPITIQSSNVDLEITNTRNTSYQFGTLSTTISIRNNGTTGVAGVAIGAQLVLQGQPAHFYESSSYLDPADTYIGPNEEKTFWLSFTIYESVPGLYEAKFKVNFQGTVAESNTTNNTYTDPSPVTVWPPPFTAITFNSASITGVVDDTDQQISLNLNLTNSGNTISFSQYYTFEIKNAQNTVLHSQQEHMWMDFSPSQTVDRTVVLNLASALPVGSYQISISCTSYCETTPSSKSIALTVSPTQYTLTGVVQGEDGQPITNGRLFLYQDDGSGNIRFIQKIVPYSGPSFSFGIDTNPHTLYFVPDPVQYPNYVPTIYGKTVSLQASNFFTASANMNATFEILKVTAPGVGPGIINGRVALGSDPSGRVMQPLTLESIEDVPVILISNTGQIVGIAYTDESGFYQFNNLPREAYKIVVSLELDDPSVMEPFSVDITEKNMSVDLVLSSDGMQPTASQLFLPQSIVFGEFTSYTYGDPSVPLDAESDSGLSIEYITSDNSIADIVNNEIIIKGVGTVVITARQAGNTFYLPASAGRTLVINKAAQTLTLSVLPEKTFGDAPFGVSGASSAGLVATLSSSDPGIASVTGNTITIHGAGSVKISAEQSGNNLYNAAPSVYEVLTIKKAAQTISFDKLPEQNIEIGSSFVLSATASSGLDVSFDSSEEEIVSITGNVASVHKDGTVTITARQSGNQNFLSAEEILQSQVIHVIQGVEVVDLDRLVFPNPTTDFIFFQIPEPHQVEVSDMLGRIRKEAIWMNGKVDFTQTEPGIYIIKFFLNGHSVITRIVKK